MSDSAKQAGATDTSGRFALEIVSPAGRVLVGTAASLVAPAIHGEVGILPGHAPYLSALEIGVVRIGGFTPAAGFESASSASAAAEARVFVAGGFLEVLENRVIVLAETAERGDRVDAARAESSRKRALERLAAVNEPSSAVDRTRARRAEKRAAARLKAAGVQAGPAASAPGHA